MKCNNTAHGDLVRLTHAVPPVVLLHHVFTIEHLVANLTGVELLAVLLLVLGQVAVGREEARADVALECLVVCSAGIKIKSNWIRCYQVHLNTKKHSRRQWPTCPAVVKL